MSKVRNGLEDGETTQHNRCQQQNKNNKNTYATPASP